MAFGGYKFKGYKVVRANLTNNTYANWCLLVHQARITAFMESCALSGAQWAFSKTNGDLSFESYGNVIYRVANGNGDYHDYLSFFQYGDEELYYMISTLGEYYMRSSDGTPYIINDAKYCGTGNTSETSRKYKFMSFSSALSLSEFPDTGPFSGGTWPTNALACSSQRCDYEDTITNWGSVNETNGHNGQLPVSGTIHCGFATRGKDIVSFGDTTWNRCCIESGNAFSSYCNTGDTYGLLKLVLGYGKTERENISDTSTLVLHYFNAECLESDGSRAYAPNSTGSNTYSNMTVVPPIGAYITPSGQNIPFESVYLSTLGINTVWSNPYNILTKGMIKPELLSMNVYSPSTKSNAPTLRSTVLGGNLITACKSCSTSAGARPTIHGRSSGYVIPCLNDSGANPSTYNLGVICYVGWDPSNPDITNGASWPELALQE